MGKGVKGHIALFLMGRYVDDPRVHDFLNTMSVYAIARHFGPGFVEGQPGLARYAWRIASAAFRPGGLAPSIEYRLVSKLGEWPTRMERVPKSVPRTSGPVTAGTRAAAARGSGLLMAGFLLYSFRPSFQFLQGAEIVS